MKQKNPYKLTQAISLGLESNLVEGYEQHGALVFRGNDCDYSGAQCGNCHNIIWFNARSNPILNQRKPEVVPNSGKQYSNYDDEKWKVLLDALPECPECGTKKFNHRVTGLEFAHFPDGKILETYEYDTKLTPLDRDNLMAWLLDESKFEKVFDKAWIKYIENKDNKDEEE